MLDDWTGCVYIKIEYNYCEIHCSIFTIEKRIELSKEIHVVGAAIQKEGLTLALQRSEAMSLPNLWEFPGGKIEEGESKEEALIREIKEELAVDIRIKEYVNTASYDYDFGRVTLSV